MKPDAQPWWRQAEADLETGFANLSIGRYYAVSWFAQQAAEKALKALYLDQHGVVPPRTHDLGLLGKTVGAPANVDFDLAGLNAVFDLVRYPGAVSGLAPVDQIGETQARGHIEAAERVIVWVKNQLS